MISISNYGEIEASIRVSYNNLGIRPVVIIPKNKFKYNKIEEIE